MIVLNDLLGYKDIKIYQDSNSFCFSLDSVLLANFVTLNKDAKKIIDLGTGNAAIPLILSTKTNNSKIVGVEIQKEIYDLGVKSISYNKLDGLIELLNDDVKNLNKLYSTNSFDVVISNPPYFKVNDLSKINDSQTKKIARHEVALNFEDLVKIASYLLKTNGVFAFVHRPERLAEFMEVVKKYGLEPKRMQFVYPKTYKDANIILVECRKAGNVGLKILPPLYVHGENGYTNEVKALFE